MAKEVSTSYTVIVENDGEIAIPEALMDDLDWHVGDDLKIDNTDARMIVTRSADGCQSDVIR